MKTFTNNQGEFLEYELSYTENDVKRIIEEHNLSGLSVRVDTPSEGFGRYDQIGNMKFLRGLMWQVVDHADLGFLYRLENLKYFSIQTVFNHLDFSKLSHLQRLSIAWHKKNVKNFSSLTNLEDLFISEFTGLDLKELSQMKKLKYLRISTAKCKTLDGIESLENLEVLVLGAFRSLHDISALAHLKNLRYLEFDICPKINDFSIIIELRNLEVLEMLDCKNIKSIAFTSNLPHLEQLSILGSSKLEDENWDVTQRIPRLCVYKKEFDYKCLSGMRKRWNSYIHTV